MKNGQYVTIICEFCDKPLRYFKSNRALVTKKYHDICVQRRHRLKVARLACTYVHKNSLCPICHEELIKSISKAHTKCYSAYTKWLKNPHRSNTESEFKATQRGAWDEQSVYI